MAFAQPKNQDQNKARRRSPLAGWLGRKSLASDDELLPQIDVQAGVSRALRSSSSGDARQSGKSDENIVRDALGAIEGALYAIDRIRDILEQACEVAISAKDVEDAGGRALLAERYDELRLSIDAILKQADPRATPLIGPNARHMDVFLGGKTRYSISPARLDTTERGFNLTPPVNAFEDNGEVDAVLEQLDGALARADQTAAGYCRDAQYLIARMNGAFS
ncbi:MAG: hypothetical protein AAFW81_04855 [Pseudomonadota bacterium]